MVDLVNGSDYGISEVTGGHITADNADSDCAADTIVAPQDNVEEETRGAN